MTPSFPRRAREASKRDFGHVVIVAGSPGLTGAAALAALAALRTGAGLVTVACPRSSQPVLAGKLTEAMTLGLPETSDGGLAASAAVAVLRFVRERHISAAAVGPGLGIRPGTARAVRDLVRGCPVPLVVDADGLNVLAGSAGVLRTAHHPVVVTPHLAEMRRLTGLSAAAISRDRRGVAGRFARKHRVVCLLKGHHTIVTDGRRAVINRTGNPGMASGGMGDVLTGIIVALLGHGRPPFEAAVTAAHLHGLAGDLAARRVGEWGLIASDVIEELPLAIHRLR